MGVRIINSKCETLCFNHAVKAVVDDNEKIDLETYDEGDAGESGFWWCGICVICSKEWDDEDEE